MRFSQTGQMQTSAAVTIRRAREDAADTVALAELAERDSGTIPTGDVLVAEVEGSILAAISVDDGTVLADPFSRTGELRNLLELRRAQLRRRARPSRLPALRRRPRAALAASPPGAGGRLLTLDPRH